ncbi:MAG TPA: HEAT repeat domain-containing protein [Lacipirellulaceae bacterium]|jgi:HEAT repeat protein|nr:HEAT repeat domain-containing protein [Lacipirellulaceae bacterium]
MLRGLLAKFGGRYISKPDIAQLLEQLDSSDPAEGKKSKEALERLCYPPRSAGGFTVWTWRQYSAFVQRHQRWFRSSPLVSALLDALDNKGVASRVFAIRALAANLEPKAFEKIVAALQDASSEVRAAAAISLLLYHYARYPCPVGPLIDLLSDPEETPRQYAANTLGSIADPLARQPLLRMLDSRSWRDRWCALHALGDICDEESLPLVRRHLFDPTKRVRKAAKAALAGYDRRRRTTLARSRPHR